MALLQTGAGAQGPSRLSKVWLGQGLGSVAKRTHDRMMRWEYVDLGELRPKNLLEKGTQEAETQKLVVLPGFELAQARQKPMPDIVTWSHCYARYTAAMAAKFPECTAGFMAHMVTVLKAYVEVEDPAWRLYDETFREKMVATGCRVWTGMDVPLYQEVCAGRLRRSRSAAPVEQRGAVKRPRVEGKSPGQGVCWQYNTGYCKYGPTCIFRHMCEVCAGPHPKKHCSRSPGEGAGSYQQ